MLAGLKRWLAPHPSTAQPALFQGYLDERSTCHVRGWVRDLNNPAARVPYEVVLAANAAGEGAAGEAERVLARGVADHSSAVLRELQVGDGAYGFDARFDPPLDRAARGRVLVRPLGGTALEHAPALVSRPPEATPPRLVGYLDERSPRHLAGWVWNEADPAERLHYEVVQHDGEGERVLASGCADQPSPQLVRLGIGDGAYAFRVLLPDTAAGEAPVMVRVADTPFVLPLAPKLQERFEPISHVALDIVNNCNLRCPFCTYDYAGTRTTRFMADDTFQAALRLLPYVTEGNFWLSCLHEATIHPELLRFIDMVPQQYRDRLMYTSNLAKRMPDAYFAQLGGSGMHHLNISLESLDPATYERLRKGARQHVFLQNWDKLLHACRTGTAPPRLRYNMMAYRSNLREIPGLVDLLLRDKLAWQVEVRYTFDEPHIPQAFREAEYLRPDEWDWLAAQLRHHDPARVLLILPPPAPPEPTASQPAASQPAASQPALPQPAAPQPGLASAPAAEPDAAKPLPAYPLGMRIEWDGTLFIYSEAAGPDGMPRHTNHLTTSVLQVREPMELIAELLA